MSSIARRSVHTAAAAVGIAALGTGIAGPALAAPSVSDLPELPALDAASVPAVGAVVPGMAEFVRAAETARAGMPALPPAFAFQTPLDAASVPTRMNVASLPAAPSTDGMLATEGTGVEFAGVPDVAAVKTLTGNVGALADLDSATMFADLAQQAASAGSVTANNDISN
ncbi:MAG: hypothetical protein L0H84_07055 [Pseudonocardia sp.]|nr:hypothetical protein [Pseudonocardia sp.]